MVGRTPRHVVVFRPLAQGATVDFDVTARLIAGLFERAGVSKLSRARVVMSVPSLATAIERRALRQAAIQAGAREVEPDRGADRGRHRTRTAGPGPRGLGGDGARRRRVGGGAHLAGRHRHAAARVAWAATTSTTPSRRCCDCATASSWHPSIIEDAQDHPGLGAQPQSRRVARGRRARAVDDGELVEVEVRADLVNAALPTS